MGIYLATYGQFFMSAYSSDHSFTLNELLRRETSVLVGMIAFCLIVLPLGVKFENPRKIFAMTVNLRTGLIETIHEFYQIPEVQQRGLSTIKFGGQQTAVHKIPLNKGLTLDFYARLGRSDEILVALHGALIPGRHKYPRFERVASLRSRAAAMMSFADPTIMADPTGHMISSWFLGGPGWDPLPWIIHAVRKACGKAGAKHIGFVGGSGGGFAALRASAMVPGSLAFIQDPQTNLAAHTPTNVNRYFETMWPGWDKEALLAAFPDRFDMVRHYHAVRPHNFVYYAQSSGDPIHVERHYEPFLKAHGFKNDRGINPAKNRVFALYEGQLAGHGKMTADEFNLHFGSAMEFWRKNRPA